MKIAYIIYPEVIISNRSNGIRSQAESWAAILREKGFTVDLIDNWSNYDWNSYDIIHFFGNGLWVYNIARRLSQINNNLVWSPIYDPQVNFIFWRKKIKETIFHHLGRLLKLPYLDQCSFFNYFKLVITRTDYESQILHKLFKVKESQMRKIPLSYSSSCKPYISKEKENFCLHISSIYQDRKNVIRLIEAAKQQNFQLVLAGNKGSDKQFEPIKNAIGDNKNIRVLGFVSEEEKIDLYKKAKVFALPSLSEGVGIVALDAAYYGCEIVITNINGPKEYYDHKCIEVNPNNIDIIGKSVMAFMNEEIQFQPQLGRTISEKFSPNTLVSDLINCYRNILQNNE